MSIRDNRFSENFYETLSIGKDANNKEIKSAYRSLALKYHPDLNNHDMDALEKFRKITEAYGILIDPKKRREYDLYLLQTERVKTWKDGCHQHYNKEWINRYQFENILKDVFKDVGAREIFEQMDKNGTVRMDERLIKQTFPSGIFFEFWGVFLICFNKGIRNFNSEDIFFSFNYFLKTIMDRFKDYLAITMQNVKGFWDSLGSKVPLEDKRCPVFNIIITPDEANKGITKIFSYKQNTISKMYKIKIPSGIKNGTKLKIKDSEIESFYLQIIIKP